MKKILFLSLFILLVLSLQLANRSLPPAPQPIAPPGPEMLPDAPELAGTAWIMASLNGALPAADTTVTLQFGKTAQQAALTAATAIRHSSCRMAKT